MDQPREKHENPDHIIDIEEGGDASSSGSSSQNSTHGLDLPHRENSNMRNTQAPVVQSSVSSSNGSNAEFPSVYKVLISIKLTYKVSLIITSIIVLVMSRHEKPQNSLYTWIVVYMAACIVSLPIIFRHYFLPYPRLCRLVDRFDWVLEFFFALLFIAGNYLVLAENSSSQAHNLYRFSIVLLVFGYIKYVGPFILHAVVLGLRGQLNQMGGAPSESIDALPTYKFKLQKSENGNGGEIDEKVHIGGVVGAGTEREHALLGDDAICCICLASYNDNDELKELPCSHFFHASCVDIWLKIKAFCPLCKCKVGKGIGDLPSATNSSQQL